MPLMPNDGSSEPSGRSWTTVSAVGPPEASMTVPPSGSATAAPAPPASTFDCGTFVATENATRPGATAAAAGAAGRRLQAARQATASRRIMLT